MSFYRYVSYYLLLAALIFSSIRIYQFECHKRELKYDLIQLSQIKYGLFNVDEWKEIISSILAKKVEELEFTPEQRAEIRKKVHDFLARTIEEFEDRYYKEKSKSIVGLMESGIASLTGTFRQLKKDVPIFTDQIMQFLSVEGNREQVKSYISLKMDEYAQRTFSKTDYTEYDEVLNKYGYAHKREAVLNLRDAISETNEKAQVYILFMSLIFSGLFLLILFTRQPTPTEFLLFTINCFVLLVVSLFLPMIEIDARIGTMSFFLFGEPVEFYDQVLYYRSKSILEVVQLLLTQQKWNIFLVGLMVLLFSVIFPISKLVASVLYIRRPELERYSLIRFLVFRTGKWSMADVMVIAIFMAYIGFTGILTEQLGQIEAMSQGFEIVTTNQSSLQMGFYLFTAFALISILISHRMQYKK